MCAPAMAGHTIVCRLRSFEFQNFEGNCGSGCLSEIQIPVSKHYFLSTQSSARKRSATED